MAYTLKESDTSLNLCIRDLSSGKEMNIQSVVYYVLDDQGKAVIVQTRSGRSGRIVQELLWVELSDLKTTIIWRNSVMQSQEVKIDRIRFDNKAEQVAFFEESKEQFHSLWYYNRRMEHALERLNDTSKGVQKDLFLSGDPSFSKNGQWLFLKLEKRIDTIKPRKDGPLVDIWGYKDIDIQPEQKRLLGAGPPIFSAVIDVKDGPLVRLENENEKMCLTESEPPGDFGVVQTNLFGDHIVDFWRDSSLQPSYYLVSFKDGGRRLIKDRVNDFIQFGFSPNGKFIVYFDIQKGSYLSYEIATGSTYDIGQNASTDFRSHNINIITPPQVASLCGWSKDDRFVFLYDNYDIWRLDTRNQNPPMNVTNNYGKRNNVKLRLLYGSEDKTYVPGEALLLVAFDCKNKYNGFYTIKLGGFGDPILLTMGPYTYYHENSQLPGNSHEFNSGMEPLKAANENVWIVQRQSFAEAPNLFLTRDFKNFSKVSDIQPQKATNWISAELITWKMLDGKLSQGVLYKPEDFDPQKKYPVIFNYYEQYSHRIYEFPYPKLIEDNIDIPLFVSNGYLVFTPDIKFASSTSTQQPVGACAYNSVVSAARFLSTYPYIDSTKIAIQGHSFGGMETGYLVTHSAMFAAAVEMSGSTDPISDYLTLRPGFSSIEHHNAQSGIEKGHYLYNSTPWERPDLYLENSAVLNADKVTAPILIMHNPKDNSIPWRQGVEFYMALTRLKKKVWMLEYERVGHIVDVKSDAKDFTIRIFQFFNYYLKNSLPPVWMSEGVPAKYKGIRLGYELDNSGKQP